MTDYYQLELDDMVIALENKDVEIEQLQKKLDIAIKVLKEYADEGNWCNCLSWNGFMEDSEVVCDGQFGEKGFVPAKNALLKMIEVIDMPSESAKEKV